MIVIFSLNKINSYSQKLFIDYNY